MSLKVALLLVLQVILISSYGLAKPANPGAAPLALTGNRVKVILKSEEAWVSPQMKAVLQCDYKVTPESDAPVTITWKVGDGPRFATDVLKCSGYTKTTRKCSSLKILDDLYSERATIAADSPSLEIQSVTIADNRNFWCQVTADEITNSETEADMQSVVLRVYGGGEMPKFHSVKIDEDFSANIDSTVTIGCECDNNNHCEDLAWFKGPTDADFTTYEMVYTRTTYSRPTPTEYKAHGDWVGRASLQGNSLLISGLKESDAGKYWCELRSSGYYGIGEWATDAKSMVLDVISTTGDFQCPKTDGNYPDYQNCQMFFECLNGKSYHRTCPVGTVFDIGNSVSTCKTPDLASSACETTKTA